MRDDAQGANLAQWWVYWLSRIALFGGAVGLRSVWNTRSHWPEIRYGVHGWKSLASALH
ncbi:hypothetical protein [Tepidimonas sp.]|uniref:hypothetical protein n=1 Tax=Tepidimonas sp. TaxID=2002775 RepID=UPI00262950DB|nr:hypothetical protein [Tepidimonas sp.]